MARRKKKQDPDDDDMEDEESARLEDEELEDYERRIREIAPDLAIGLRAAVRLLVHLSNKIEADYAWRNEWALIEPAHQKLEAIDHG